MILFAIRHGQPNLTFSFGNIKSLSFIALFVAGISALGAGIEFPSTASSKSPDGRWKLTCKGPAEGMTDLRHLLLLTKVGGRSFELQRIDRNCNVLWSPDSARIAVTDRWASDRADIFIYSVANRISGKGVPELLPTKAIPAEELDGHCYFEACEWVGPSRLRFRVSGHTDEFPVHSFDHNYVFEVRSGRFEKTAKKKPNQTVQRTGATRSGVETDRTPVASGSRR